MSTAASVQVQAQEIVPPGMQNLMDQLLTVFTGNLVRGILILSLAGCAIGYGVWRDNEKMKRNVIAIGIATIVIMAASGIVEALMRAMR